MKKLIITLGILIAGCSSNTVIAFKPDRIVKKIIPVKVVKAEEKEQLVFEMLGANFPVNGYKITEKTKEEIKELAFKLKGKEGVLKIVGAASSTGRSSYNLKLSKKRANSIAKVLQEELKGEKIEILIEGLGEDYPEFSNETKEGKARNRNTKLFFLEKGSGKNIKYVENLKDI